MSVPPLRKVQKPRVTISLRRGKEETTPRRAKTAISDLPIEEMIVRPKTTTGNRPVSSYNLSAFVRSSRLFETKMKTIKKPPKTIEESKRNTVTSPKEWVSDYVRSKLANSAALKIQRCWRNYSMRKQWGGLFHRRIWSRKDALLRIFVGWRGYTTKNFNVMVDCYNRFTRFQLEKKWLGTEQNIAPFNVFYLTDNYFIPNLVTPRQYTFIARVFAHPESRFILKLWKFAAHTQKVFREKSLYFFFTVKKRQHFGFIFSAFHLWHNFTVWKRKSKKDPEFYHLEQSEVMIDWNVREKFLKKTKALNHTADNTFKKNIKKKALIAVHQRLVEKRQLSLDYDSSGQFYLHHLMELCRKAWVHFVLKQRARRQELLRLQKIWYTTSYNMALEKTNKNVLSNFHKKFFTSQVFRGWQKESRLETFKALINAFAMQKKPSLARQFVLKLYGLDSLVFFERVWKEWIAYTHKRRNWHKFVSICNQDAGDLELKQICYYGIKKHVDHQTFKRIVHSNNTQIYDLALISLEGIYKNMENINQKSNTPKIIKEKIPKEEKEIIPKSDTAEEKIPKEEKPKSDTLQEILPKSDNPKEKNLRGNTFTKILLIALDSIKNGDKAKIIKLFKAVDNPQTTNDVKVHYSFNEILHIYNNNCKQLYKLMRYRIARDSILISGLATHSAAIQLRKILPFFVTYNSDDFMKFPDIKTPNINLNLSDDVIPSLKEHKRSLEMKKGQIPTEILSILSQGKTEFKCRMRPPIIIYGDSNSLFDNSVENFSSDNVPASESKANLSSNPSSSQANQKSREIRASLTSFTRPNLGDFTPPHKTLFLTVLKENLGNRTPSQGLLSNSMLEFAPSFSSEVLSPKLEHSEAYSGLRRFFTNSAQIRLDMKSSDTQKAEETMTKTQKRTMRRNINAFYAGMLGIDASKNVPMDVNPPQWLKNIAEAIIACHFELKKFQSVYSFCGEIPFPRKFLVDDPANIELRSMIYVAVTKKFPRLAKTENAIKRDDNQDMTRTDLYVAMLSLPYIFKAEYVADFLKDEIKIDQMKHETE